MKLFKELSLTDQLTNIPNRRAIEVTGLKTFSEAQRYAHPLTIAILDLDRFKHVNDTYGHAAGDVVLYGVAQCLQSGLRISDVYGRWGGEEFLILLPSTKLQAAKRPLDRLLDLIRNTPFRIDHKDIHATASIGIAEISKTDDTFEALVSRADVALYEAKTAGRDRVMAA